MNDWADVLTDKLLKEEPQDKPLREIMADALRAERKRCAGIARAETWDEYELAQATDIGRGRHIAATDILALIEDNE